MRSAFLEADRGDRAKAAILALAINLLLGIAFITGMALHEERTRDSALATFDVNPPPPPPPPIAERSVALRASRQAAPSARKAEASPIVAPAAALPVKQIVQAAKVAGEGATSTAGAANAGNGTGAGGAGNGLGGGGNGGGGNVIGARLVSGALGRSDYRQIAQFGGSRGDAELLLLVNPQGRIERCRALRSSGNPGIDDALCQMLQARARFDPAHGADGTLYYQDVHYFPRWSR